MRWVKRTTQCEVWKHMWLTLAALPPSSSDDDHALILLSLTKKSTFEKSCHYYYYTFTTGWAANSPIVYKNPKPLISPSVSVISSGWITLGLLHKRRESLSLFQRVIRFPLGAVLSAWRGEERMETGGWTRKSQWGVMARYGRLAGEAAEDGGESLGKRIAAKRSCYLK